MCVREEKLSSGHESTESLLQKEKTVYLVKINELDFLADAMTGQYGEMSASKSIPVIPV